MEKDALPREVTQYVIVMRILGVLFAISGGVFLLLPNFVIDLINIGPNHLGLFEPLPPGADAFWLVLGVSMMVMLAILCIAASYSPEIKVLAWTVMAAKLCSSTNYLLFFAFSKHYFGYLVGFITDFPLFLVVSVMAYRAFRALARQERPAA